MRWAWLAILIAIPLILVINFIDASSSREPLPWKDIPYAIGIGIWATGILWLARRWFNFMAGSDLCKWREKP
jgi:hypothetical protein